MINSASDFILLMSTMTSQSASGAACNVIPSSGWQAEMKQLYSNFFVIENLLSQSDGLPVRTRNQYETLQQTIIDTIERLLDELDRSEVGQSNRISKPNQLLNQHALVIRQLNARVDRLAGEVTV